MDGQRYWDNGSADLVSFRIIALACSAIMITGALVLPVGRLGITEASTTRRFSTPRTRSSLSSGARASLPMRQLPAG